MFQRTPIHINLASSSSERGPLRGPLSAPSKMFKKRRRRRRSLFARPPVVEDLSKSLIPVMGSKPFALLLHNLLTPGECADLIQCAEDAGFDDALIQGPGGQQVLDRDVRSCRRCIIDDVVFADAVYARITNAVRGTEFEKKIATAPWVSAERNDGTTIEAVGLNERMRFLKYDPGNFFAPHRDLKFVRGPDHGDRAGETSHVTVQLYLNEKFKGGATRFLSCMSGKRHYDVKPRTGSVLIFDHDLLHEGRRVSGGPKYSVRTDIMFTPPRQSTE